MDLLDLFVKIVFDSSDYDKGIDKTKKGNKSLTDSFGGVKKSAETVRNTIGVLKSQYDSARKNVEELTKKFNESANKTGVASKETQDLAKQLKDAEAQMNSIGQELQQYNSGLDQNAKKADEAGKNAGKLGNAFKKGFFVALKSGAAIIGAATTAIAGLVTASIKGYSELEQLAGGAAKIFDEISQSRIMADAYNAYKLLGMSANEYLAIINDVGATFASTMGDEAGYETALRGLRAISDYASGTGKSVDELSQKFTLITRSSSSYQSIADQFSGILPATSSAFLEQAQAAGILSDTYKELTDVPLPEYQAAVAKMLEKGVDALGLTGNTAAEAFNTISGSIAMAKASWGNLITGLSDDTADMNQLIDNFVVSVTAVADNAMPKVEKAIGGVVQLVASVLPVALGSLPGRLTGVLPQLADAVLSIIDSLIVGLDSSQGDLAAVAVSVVSKLVSGILTATPKLFGVALSLITSLARGLAAEAPALVPTAVLAVLELVNGLTNPEAFSALIDGAIALIMGLTDGLIAALPILLESAPGIIENLVNALIENLPKLVLAGLDFMIALSLGMVENLPEIASAAWQIIETLFSSLGEYATKLVETGKTAIDKIKEGLEAAWEDLSGYGETVMEMLMAGLESGWEALKSWFDGVWESTFGNLIANVTVVGGETIVTNSRNAGGLDYVPFNGYLSELHRGEMVLTADEADDYRRGNRGGKVVTVIQHIYSEAKTAADLMEEAVYQQEKAVLLGV